jgi:hypothetical protein
VENRKIPPKKANKGPLYREKGAFIRLFDKTLHPRPRRCLKKNIVHLVIFCLFFAFTPVAGLGLTRQPSTTMERTPSVDRRDGLDPLSGPLKLGGLPKWPKNP